jgi:hypothetical protein
MVFVSLTISSVECQASWLLLTEWEKSGADEAPVSRTSVVCGC